MVKHLVVSAIAQLVLTQSPSWCEFRNARSKSGFLVAACEKARRLGSKFCIDVAFVRLRKNMSCELPTNITNITNSDSKFATSPGKVLWMLVALEPWIRTRQPRLCSKSLGGL